MASYLNNDNNYQMNGVGGKKHILDEDDDMSDYEGSDDDGSVNLEKKNKRRGGADPGADDESVDDDDNSDKLSQSDDDEGDENEYNSDDDSVNKANADMEDVPVLNENENPDENSEDEDEDDDPKYLKKFDENLKRNVIADYHPEIHQHNYEEVNAMCTVTRNADGIIIDPLHTTVPFLTKYEKARILGERAKQINAGGATFIDVDPSIIDGYLIALKELEQKKIPFIIKRPLPNGGCEYWRIKDLEIIA